MTFFSQLHYNNYTAYKSYKFCNYLKKKFIYRGSHLYWNYKLFVKMSPMILVGFSHTHEGIYPFLVLYGSYSFMNIRHNGWWRKTKMWQSLVYVNHWLVISKLTSYFRWQIRKIFMCNWRLFLSSVVKACILENPVADRIIRNDQCRRQNY